MNSEKFALLSAGFSSTFLKDLRLGLIDITPYTISIEFTSPKSLFIGLSVFYRPASYGILKFIQ